LTRQYLEGGWPSTTFLTPNGERITGYSGVRPIENLLINFKQIVEQVKNEGYYNKELTLNYSKTPQIVPTIEQLKKIKDNYLFYSQSIFDSEFGGFGLRQKFPQPLTLDAFLAEFEQNGNQDLLKKVELTFENQNTLIEELKTNYNLFDPVEGGFHRYGTVRDWSPPHFEKMLEDNSGLLRVFSHLYSITKKEEQKNVVLKTKEFLLNQFFDKENSGFYGSSDADEKYFFLTENERKEKKKPFIDKTKYTEWNSKSVVDLLFAATYLDDPDLEKVAISTLKFLEKNNTGKNGALHYFDEKKQLAFLDGQLIDNSWLLLALTTGFEKTQDKLFLEKAIQIADFSLNNLYDWQSGGFFERNSSNSEVYSVYETMLLKKPFKENQVMALAFLKLFLITNDEKYLNAAIKTIGNQADALASLDRGYYGYATADFVLKNNLLESFQASKEKIEKIELEGQKNFFLIELLNTSKINERSGNSVTGFVELSNEGIEPLSSSLIVLFIIALIAGFLSFLSPCTLPIIPAYFATTFKSDKKKVLINTIFFFFGLALVFTSFGVTASFIGSFLNSNRVLLSQLAGVLIVMFGLMQILNIGFSGIKFVQRGTSTVKGSFVFGIAFGVGWSACIGPILSSILILASSTQTIFEGGALLFTYAVGLSLPLIFLSAYFEKINKQGRIWKFFQGKDFIVKIFGKKLFLNSTTLISGIFLILIGIAIFTGLLYTLNQIVISTPIQQYIIGIEDLVIEFFR